MFKGHITCNSETLVYTSGSGLSYKARKTKLKSNNSIKHRMRITPNASVRGGDEVKWAIIAILLDQKVEIAW